MPLHDEVWINYTKGGTTEIKEQVSRIWANGCIFDDSLCVI